MKKTITLILSFLFVVSMAIVPAAAIKMADEPIPGPEAPTLWTQKEMMYEGEPEAASPWSNAFCNEDWTGLTWVSGDLNGIPVICVSPVPFSNSPYMDFNYYQWNNDKYYPSLVCGNYPFFAYRVAYNAAGVAKQDAETIGLLWCSVDSNKLGKTADTGTLKFERSQKTYKADTFYTDIADLSNWQVGSKLWSEWTIRQFRFYPFGDAGGLTGNEIAYVEWIGFFKTREEAESYVNPAELGSTKSGIKTADQPIPGPEAPTQWFFDEFMYTGEPEAASPWSNAFCNEDWTGLTWVAGELNGIKVAAVSPVPFSNSPYMDFNYYQWNNDKYYPSLVCGNYPIFAYSVAYNEAGAEKVKGTAGTFWCSVDSKKLGKVADTGSFNFARATEEFKANTFYTDIADFSTFKVGSKMWTEWTIRQYRFFPFGNAQGLTGNEIAYVAWVAFFPTKAEAEAFDPFKAPETEAPAPETQAPAPVTQAPAPTPGGNTTPAPATADLAVVIAAVAAVSAGAAIVISKKRR